MYNKVILVGNLTRAIELRYLPSGSAIAKSAIATSFKYKATTGEQKDEVCYLDFNVFGRSAEVANQYLKKGSKVLLEGRLVFEQWTAQDGSTRSRHSLRVDSMKMLDSKGDSETTSERKSSPQGNNGSRNQPSAYSQNTESNHDYRASSSMNEDIPDIDIDENDIPF